MVDNGGPATRFYWSWMTKVLCHHKCGYAIIRLDVNISIEITR